MAADAEIKGTLTFFSWGEQGELQPEVKTSGCRTDKSTKVDS
jgi:hypothetical protein